MAILAAAAAAHLLKNFVNIRFMTDDDRLIANALERLPEDVLRESKEMYGDDLKSKRVSGHTFCDIVRMYAALAEETIVYERFQEYLRHKKLEEAKRSLRAKPGGTEEAPIIDEKEVDDEAAALFNQFVYAARKIATAERFHGCKLHTQNVFTLSALTIEEEETKRSRSIAASIRGEFKVAGDNRFIKDILEDIYGEDWGNILLHMVIRAAEQEFLLRLGDKNSAIYQETDAGNLVKTIYNVYFPHLEVADFLSPEAIRRGLIREGFTDELAEWADSVKNTKYRQDSNPDPKANKNGQLVFSSVDELLACALSYKIALGDDADFREKLAAMSKEPGFASMPTTFG
ncbi:MAG: hypothetical protein EB060_00665 [Proteobacteria bacterium]|nr:hypothetical protein [Pseudomonadota bacterium]